MIAPLRWPHATPRVDRLLDASCWRLYGARYSSLRVLWHAHQLRDQGATRSSRHNRRPQLPSVQSIPSCCEPWQARVPARVEQCPYCTVYTQQQGHFLPLNPTRRDHDRSTSAQCRYDLPVSHTLQDSYKDQRGHHPLFESILFIQSNASRHQSRPHSKRHTSRLDRLDRHSNRLDSSP